MAVRMSGAQAWPSKAADYARRTSASLFKWLSVASLLVALASISIAFGLDDLGSALGLIAIFVGAYGIARTYPALTAGVAALVVIKKRHAVMTFLMAFAVFALFAVKVNWMSNFTYAVVVSAAYWLLVMAMVFKNKPWHMILFMFILLGIVIKGAIDLLGEQSIAFTSVISSHPDLSFSLAVSSVAALWIFFILRSGASKEKVSEKDLRRYDEEMRAWEFRHRRQVVHMRRMSKLEEEDPDKYLQEFEKGKDLDLHPGPEPKRPGGNEDPSKFFVTVAKIAIIFWLAVLSVGARLLFF